MVNTVALQLEGPRFILWVKQGCLSVWSLYAQPVHMCVSSHSPKNMSTGYSKLPKAVSVNGCPVMDLCLVQGVPKINCNWPQQHTMDGSGIYIVPLIMRY